MKVPADASSSIKMDNNKLKFSDRLKALLKTESRQDVDPYVFSEPEPFVTSGGKNFKPTHGKAHHSIVKSNKSRGKCIKRRIKIEDSSIARMRVETSEDNREGDSTSVERGDGTTGSIEPRYTICENNCDANDDSVVEDTIARTSETRGNSRDHTLLYYPRAGDEISDSESSGDELSVYQRHWFSDVTSDSSQNRTARLSQLRSQLRRRLIQLHKGGRESEASLRERTRCLLEESCKKSLANGFSGSFDDLATTNGSKITTGSLLIGGPCVMDGCRSVSLPCTRHCSRHIMLNADQLLFEHCTAKFSDNTQCCVPVFDVAHELPLCPEHARKRDNYHRRAQESKPKKSRKKPASPTTAPRPKIKSSRPKKRKRPTASSVVKLETKIAGFVHDEMNYPSQVASNNENHTRTLNNLNAPQSTSNNTASMNLGLGLGPLGLGGGLKVELGDHEVFASLDPAEHDFGNVLNNLPADAFNDIFIESRNGEYEPSREEEEELERALEAVDKDVRNLERMGQTHGLLEPALLAQLMSDIAS